MSRSFDPLDPRLSDEWFEHFAQGAAAPIERPLKVFQRDRLVGTVPGYPVKSRSGIFDIRPGDFRPEQRDGETVLIASPMIGPGDFACIEGFRLGDGGATEPGEAAKLFDTLAALGGSRAETMKATIKDLLGQGGPD